MIYKIKRIRVSKIDIIFEYLEYIVFRFIVFRVRVRGFTE